MRRPGEAGNVHIYYTADRTGAPRINFAIRRTSDTSKSNIWNFPEVSLLNAGKTSDPILTCNPQPTGNHRVPVDRFFGPDNLGRLERACQMQRLGYPQSIETQPVN